MNDQNEESGIYYYHADHLGSSSVVTDKNGKFHEHLEYDVHGCTNADARQDACTASAVPYGETWINDRANNENLPYRFTGKELDPETGLYFYGARYYDSKLSRWISADPILNSYLDGKPNGGVYNSINLDMYNYCASNPVRFIDPTGMAWDNNSKSWIFNQNDEVTNVTQNTAIRSEDGADAVKAMLPELGSENVDAMQITFDYNTGKKDDNGNSVYANVTLTFARESGNEDSQWTLVWFNRANKFTKNKDGSKNIITQQQDPYTACTIYYDYSEGIAAQVLSLIGFRRGVDGTGGPPDYWEEYDRVSGQGTGSYRKINDEWVYTSGAVHPGVSVYDVMNEVGTGVSPQYAPDHDSYFSEITDVIK